MRDYYDILNVEKTSSEDEIKKAYRKVAMKYHPDRGGSPQEFQQISIAYTILTKKLKESQNNHSHNELRNESTDFIQNQLNQPKVNINMTENNSIIRKNKNNLFHLALKKSPSYEL